MNDLWTIVNPRSWMTLLPGVVATSPNSITISYAIHPERKYLEFVFGFGEDKQTCFCEIHHEERKILILSHNQMLK